MNLLLDTQCFYYCSSWYEYYIPVFAVPGTTLESWLVQCRLSSLSTASVTLNTGRPDLTAVVKEVAANRGSGDCMGVWSAGPKAMNNLVYEASGRLGGDVRLFPLAYEM